MCQGAGCEMCLTPHINKDLCHATKRSGTWRLKVTKNTNGSIHSSLICCQKLLSFISTNRIPDTLAWFRVRESAEEPQGVCGSWQNLLTTAAFRCVDICMKTRSTSCFNAQLTYTSQDMCLHRACKATRLFYFVIFFSIAACTWIS